MGYLRTATIEDMDLLFEWANNPTVRQNSFQTAEIPYAEHQEWYRRLLKREDCRQYIYVCDDEVIGQIRVTVENDAAEIGYSVCEEKRGMGYGQEMLRLLPTCIKRDFPQVKRLTARVKPENTGSQKAFLKAGFKEIYYEYETQIRE